MVSSERWYMLFIIIAQFSIDKQKENTYHLDALLATQVLGVVGLVPGTEWCSIDQHDAILHQRLGTHQLVVRGIVDHIDNTSLAGAIYGRPKIKLVKLNQSLHQ